MGCLPQFENEKDASQPALATSRFKRSLAWRVPRDARHAERAWRQFAAGPEWLQLRPGICRRGLVSGPTRLLLTPSKLSAGYFQQGRNFPDPLARVNDSARAIFRQRPLTGRARALTTSRMYTC